MADIYRAKEAFAFTDNGFPRVVPAGELLYPSDPAYKGREKLFERVEVAAARAAGIEEATAAPGEKRSVSTSRRGRRTADHAPTVTPQSDPPPSESKKAPQPKKEGDES